MGVPKFFRYISERYPCLSELVRENQVPEFDNLYLDMNGIIHNCSHPNDNDVHFRITEEQIFKDIFFYLETLFNMIQPQKLFFLAVDGVAPRAKMNQQRGRRFRSAKEAELQEEKARQKGEKLPEEARFDSNCITPGTPFMCRLDKALRYFIQYKISTSKAWRNCEVILSGHQTPGEGEHKIMEYIRYLKAGKGGKIKLDPNTRHCLYGLDADLVMLGLCTHERHFSLLREEVKFGKKNSKCVSVDQQRFFLLHLSLLREYLELEFISIKDNLKFPFDIEKVIDDWVLMGFLVGNDFIPNIPNLHIQSNALPMLYGAYMKTLPTLDGYINDGGELNLTRLQVFMENLDKFDRENFSSTYDDLKFLESKHQSGFNNRNDDTFGGNKDLLDLVKATDFEFDSHDEDDNVFASNDENNEDLDDDEIFEKEFHQHRRDYYVNKMKYEEMTPAVLEEQALCYVTALQWTLYYYYHGVPSWGYFYPHHYAPFISDLKNFKNFNLKFDAGKPFLPFQQLMSVLPAASKDHVPSCYKPLMTSPESELIDFYPVNFETDLNGKKQEWEAVVLIPFIEEERLLKTLKKYDDEMTPDEKNRNVHGPMFLYKHDKSSQGSLAGPENFPSIGNLMCKETKIYREEIQVPKDKLILGPSKGSLQNVYYAGFPTLKHLNYHKEMRVQHVRVFDQPSRGENMLIVVESPEDKPLEMIVKDLMSKIVYVGWPHLMEAKIVRITDREKTHFSDGNVDKTDPMKWKMDVQAIKDHHINRMGIEIGDVTRLVHVLQATGEEYRFDAKMKMFRTIKTWNKVEAAYPLQTIVTNIKTYRKKMKEELPLFEAFKTGTEVIMIKNPYYGSMGEVVDTNCYEKTGRVKVLWTVLEEPKFDGIWDLHQKSQGSYMNPYQAASKLSISDNVLNRITGTVLVIAGMKRQISDGTSKLNIGLQMKYAKQNEELTGYTRKERTWLYSEKAINLVQEYYCKFPQIFEVMERRTSHNNNDVYFESDFFGMSSALETEDNLHNLMKWLNQSAHNKAERRTIGTEAIEKEVIDELVTEVKKSKDLPIKKVTMQVKPHLLYVPSLSKMTTKSPDYTATFELFDRVVIARESDKYSVGMKGTIVGISRVKDLNPVRQDCVNKEDVYCSILFDDLNGRSRTGRVAVENIVNITYGSTMSGGERVAISNPNQQQQQQNQLQPQFNKIQSRNQNNQNNNKNNNANNKVDNQAPKYESFSAALQSKQQPQKHQNFLEMWNSLKGSDTFAEPVFEASSSNQQSQAAAQPNADAQKKLNEAMNKKMAELAIKKKQSPTPNDQSVPIMIKPPSKLPTPPIEWLVADDKNSSNFEDESVNRPVPIFSAVPNQAVTNHPHYPMQYNPNPRLKLEMPTSHQIQQPLPPPQQQQQQQLGSVHQFFGNNNNQRSQQQQQFVPFNSNQHPMPIYPQTMVPPPHLQHLQHQQPSMPMSAPIIRQQQGGVGPYFQNNQQQQQQQQPRFTHHNFQQLPPQQQRYFQNNSMNNGNNNMMLKGQGNFRQQQQYMPMTAPIASSSSSQSGQNNPFIPLQAARKGTKGKDVPAYQNPKEQAQKYEEEVPLQASQVIAVEESSQLTATIQNDVNEEKPEEIKPPTVKTPIDPRKSRLAIKF